MIIATQVIQREKIINILILLLGDIIIEFYNFSPILDCNSKFNCPFNKFGIKNTKRF